MKKILLIILFTVPFIGYGQYDGFKRNPDGTYVVGGMYDGFKRNPDGTYVVSKKPCNKCN
jgi:hypothetical protein